MAVKKANELPKMTFKDIEEDELRWKVNTGQLLKEVMENNSTQILNMPMTIFRNILVEVGVRCAEINDDKLNALMCRLAIYEIADPYSGKFNAELTDALIKKGYRHEDTKADTTTEDRS